jgi:hypothetical protein
MKTYQVTFTTRNGGTTTFQVQASDLDDLYTTCYKRYPHLRILGPSAIRCIDNAR